MNKSKFDSWVTNLNRMRAQWSDAEVDFWIAVMEFEADSEAWSRKNGNGYLCFEEALHVAGVKSPHEYRKFKACVAYLGGTDKVKAIGFDAAKELLDVPKDAPSIRTKNSLALDAIYSELVEFRTKHGKEPAGQTAATKVRQHYAPPEPPEREVLKLNAFDRLKLENTELKKALRVAKQRMAHLEKENEALKSRLASGGAITKTKAPLAGRKNKGNDSVASA
jgi:flagellar motility protein MotE (MotC chaperone)